MVRKVVIMGAAGRDFHNFNIFFRNNKHYRVVAFTAAQIPNIDNRRYPPELAGELYPEGIPILSEEKLPRLVEEGVSEVFFSYSDVSHEYVMHRASLVQSLGASFTLLGPKDTMLESKKPVIAVCAVRTGSGKSQTTGKVARILRKHGAKPVIIRHPMPYGKLVPVLRFGSVEDLDRNCSTIEEREDYEQHVEDGFTVFSGADYEAVLKEAEKEGEVIIWDGGNNDIPFIKPDMHIVVLDPLRAGDERRYYPGETNFLMADLFVINKMDSAEPEQKSELNLTIERFRKDVPVIEAESRIIVGKPEALKGKRVLVIGDGPSLTHGNLPFTAGSIAAEKLGVEIVDAKDFAVGSIKEVFEKYPHIRNELPAVGYSKEELKDLEETVNNSDADVILLSTPADLAKVIDLKKPVVRVRYELEEISKLTLEEVILDFLRENVNS
ncbi:MAG: GTPase [Candidatus Aenigmatarchaeota archaeon]|nr:MAG: GTPase [Candidatus Aenigmarchaeota archaeon]